MANDVRKKVLRECRVGTFHLRWDLTELDDFFREKARTELRETPEIKPDAFKQLRLLLQGCSSVGETPEMLLRLCAHMRERTWGDGASLTYRVWRLLIKIRDHFLPIISITILFLLEEPDLHVPKDDEFLQMFLRPCKWYPKSAFQLMKRNYRFMLTHPRISNNLIPTTEEAAFSSSLLIPMPVRTNSGSRLVLLSGGTNWKPKEVTIDSLFRLLIIALSAAIQEERTQVCGTEVIIDLEGFSLSHVTALSPSSAAMIAEWVQRCQPSRLKGIHIVNQPFIFNVGFALFKPFLLDKTRKRIHFHGKDRTSLLNHLGAACVPDFLGGDFIMPEEPLGPAIWRYFCQFNDLYEQAQEYGYKKEKKG